MNLVQIVAQVLWSAGVPALVIFIPLNEVHQLRHIVVGIALQRVGRIRAQSPRIDFFRFFVHPLGKFVGGRILAIDLVAQAPGKDAGVVSVACDHFLQLLESVLHDF